MIRRCTKEDFEDISNWCRQWGFDPIADWYFPEDVFIVPGIISASYYKTNSKVAYIENIISSPDASSEDRQKGLGMLGDHIFKLAAEDGFRVVLGITNHPSVASVSAAHGMELSKPNYSILTKRLMENN